MPVTKFTKANVRNLLASEPAGKKITETVSPLVLKITAGGGQWIVVKSINGQIKTFTPRTPDGAVIKNAATIWPPEQARQWAVGVVGSLAKGETPQPQKRIHAPTFAQVAAAHLEDYAAKARPSSVTTRRYGIGYCLPHLGTAAVNAIGVEQAVALRDAFGSPATATKAWIAASEVMSYAMTKGHVAAIPFKAVPAPVRPAARDRYPVLEQIGRIWAAAEEDGTVGARLIQFIFATGLRVGAAASLEWSEVDVDNAELVLQPRPGRKFKSVVRLPLGTTALELLKAQPRRADTELVFPGEDRRRQPTQFRSWTSVYARLQAASETSAWSAHDVRRAIVSITADHRDDVDVLALDRLLQHSGGTTIGTVGATYQRATFLRRMRHAINAWDALLSGAISGRVVSLAEVA